MTISLLFIHYSIFPCATWDKQIMYFERIFLYYNEVLVLIIKILHTEMSKLHLIIQAE